MKNKYKEIEKELNKLEIKSKCCKLDITTMLLALIPLYILFAMFLLLIFL